jgi:hypothetical protein
MSLERIRTEASKICRGDQNQRTAEKNASEGQKLEGHGQEKRGRERIHASDDNEMDIHADVALTLSEKERWEQVVSHV